MKTSWPLFHTSMQFSKDYCDLKKCEGQWKIIEDRYNAIRNQPPHSEKIPRIVHQIWLGGKLPESERKMTEQVMSSLGKEWKYKLWTDANISELNRFDNRDAFDKTPNLGQKSDLLRIAILKEFGGIYMDTDFILVGNLDEFLDLEFFCGVAYDSEPTMFNGLIGSTKDNPIIDDLLKLDRDVVYHDAMELMDSTGPFFLTRKVFKNIKNVPGACILPVSFFYPFPNFSRSRTNGSDYKNYIKDETACCHMWASKWM